MCDKKNSIYEIYEWMGMVGKYTGCFPLPGLYQKKEWSKWTKGFINYVIPAINFTYFLWELVTSLIYTYYSYYFVKPKNLIDFLYQIFSYCYFAHYLLCIVLNHFYLRRQLVSFLNLHSNVDELLGLKKRQLKRFLNLFFVILIVFFTVKEQLNFIIRNSLSWNEWFFYYYENPGEALREDLYYLSASFFFSIAVDTHSYLMYCIFQRILKSSFDQLLVKIEENRNEKLSREMRVKKMRKYMRLYCALGKLCSRLDYTVSPLLLIQFLLYYLETIHRLTFMFNGLGLNVESVSDVVSGFFVLFFVSNFACLTEKSRDKILPAIYSTFNLDEKAVKTELQNFSLQSMYFNKSFSASGFLKLDRELILTIFQSIISQVVIFFKIYQENHSKKSRVH